MFAAGLDLPIVLAVYERMKAAGVAALFYDYEKVYQVLPWSADKDATFWAKQLRKYGEDIVDYWDAQHIIDDVRAGKIKVVKIGVCESESELASEFL
jgi:hypothetical protein